VRSRYSAFALGLGDYLVKTLAEDHPDRAVAADALSRELARAKDRQRFLGLTILDTRADGDDAEVTFHARIFERGQNRSFTERSRFVREEGRWRYAEGEILDDGHRASDLETVASPAASPSPAGVRRKGR
jgi:SEC-C motif-containing protein